MLYLATGIQPFDKDNEYECFYKIEKGINPYDDLEFKDKHKYAMVNQNHQLKELLNLCFKRNSYDRPTAEQIFQHPFFAGQESTPN